MYDPRAERGLAGECNSAIVARAFGSNPWSSLCFCLFLRSILYLVLNKHVDVR